MRIVSCIGIFIACFSVLVFAMDDKVDNYIEEESSSGSWCGYDFLLEPEYNIFAGLTIEEIVQVDKALSRFANSFQIKLLLEDFVQDTDELRNASRDNEEDSSDSSSITIEDFSVDHGDAIKEIGEDLTRIGITTEEFFGVMDKTKDDLFSDNN